MHPLTLCSVLMGLAAVAVARPANIVLMMADDFGYECVTANGGESYRTPHLDRIGKELRIEIKTDRRNVPRLFAAEQVARTANLEIRERQLESGAEVRRIEDRLEALARIIGERLFASIEQITPGTTTAAANATTQLIELCEAEAIGAINDDRVRVRNVETRFDDGGADEDLRFAAHELTHHALQCALLHLPVPHHHARIGNESANLLRCRFN